MNNILVIGGAGYIGSHITYELCDSGYSVRVLDNLSSGFIDNIDGRADFINGSFTDLDIICSALKDIDCVIHLAALKAAGDSMDNPVEYSNRNIVDSISLINNCVINNIKNFIFSSSAAVYGHPNYLPIDEKHPLNPINYYGYTKLCIENQLLWYHKLKGLNICSLRYFNAAGYDIKGRIIIPENKVANLLPIVMETALGKRKVVEIYGEDYKTKDGTCNRDYIHVNDLALAHLKSIESLESRKDPILLNLATGLSHSVLDVIKMAEEITNKKIPYKFVSRREGDSPELYSISNDAEKILDWVPKYSDLNTILESMWEVYKKL